MKKNQIQNKCFSKLLYKCNKKLQLTSILIFMFFSMSFGQGLEDFTNLTVGSTYSDGSFVGNNAITWTYTKSRDYNKTSGITAPALFLRGKRYDSKVISSSIPGGIKKFSVKLYKGFTGKGNRQVELFINGKSKGKSEKFNDYDVHIFTIDNINISGDFTIEIKNITSKQIIIDDILWTDYKKDPNANPEISISVSKNKTNEIDAEKITVTATLSKTSTKPTIVNLSVTGTNIESSDYTLESTQITIPTNKLVATTSITILNDINEEDEEILKINITKVTAGIDIATSSTTITITDDDKIVKGSESLPFTISEVILTKESSKIHFAVGYIVGHLGNFTAPFKDDYKITVADSKDEKDYSKCMILKLESNNLEKWGLKTNPNNIGKQIKFNGNRTKYYGHVSFKSNTKIEEIATAKVPLYKTFLLTPEPIYKETINSTLVVKIDANTTTIKSTSLTILKGAETVQTIAGIFKEEIYEFKIPTLVVGDYTYTVTTIYNTDKTVTSEKKSFSVIDASTATPTYGAITIPKKITNKELLEFTATIDNNGTTINKVVFEIVSKKYEGTVKDKVYTFKLNSPLEVGVKNYTINIFYNSKATPIIKTGNIEIIAAIPTIAEFTVDPERITDQTKDAKLTVKIEDNKTTIQSAILIIKKGTDDVATITGTKDNNSYIFDIPKLDIAKYILSITVTYDNNKTLSKDETLNVISLSESKNLLLNGNLENWTDENTPTGWTKVENGTKELKIKHGGKFSIKHVGGTKKISQTIKVKAGKKYLISIWYYIESGDETNARIWSYWKDKDNKNITDNGEELRGPNGGYFENKVGSWEHYETKVTAPELATNLYFEVRTYGTAIVYWDDFSVIEYVQVSNQPIIETPSISPNPIFTTDNLTVTVKIDPNKAIISSVNYTLIKSSKSTKMTKSATEGVYTFQSTETMEAGDVDYSIDVHYGDNKVIKHTGTFTVNTITEVDNIKLLYTLKSGTYVNLTNDVLITYSQSSRNQKYIEDATGAILIDDADGIITSELKIGDKVPGIKGKLKSNWGTLQIQPIKDVNASSSNNVVTPTSITINDLNGDNAMSYISKLVKIMNVKIYDVDGGSGKFVMKKNYRTIFGTDTTILRTSFADADYISQDINTNSIDIVAIVKQFKGKMQITPRSTADITTHVTTSIANNKNESLDITIKPNPITDNFEINLSSKYISIYNLQGIIVKQVKNYTAHSVIDISELQKGIYVVVCTINKKKLTKLIIKN